MILNIKLYYCGHITSWLYFASTFQNKNWRWRWWWIEWSGDTVDVVRCLALYACRFERSSDDGPRGVAAWEGLRHAGGVLPTTVSWRPRPLCQATAASSSTAQHRPEVPELSVLEPAVPGWRLVARDLHHPSVERHLHFVATLRAGHSGWHFSVIGWPVISDEMFVYWSLLHRVTNTQAFSSHIGIVMCW